MLPAELLATRKRKGNIMPRYLEDTRLPHELIQIFTQYQGKKYKELLAKLEELEEGDNFKLVRGLSTLLERRCTFTSSSDLSGKEIRSFLFQHGFVKTIEDRKKILEEAAKQFHTSTTHVEEAFFSDMPEEQLLSTVNPVSAEELMQQYNLSLTQTLLFDALELMFTAEENYQQIFRHIKYLGLMYEINGGVHVTGPASLFKKNRKYGTSLAKLLPSIVRAKTWEINAQIETCIGGEPRLFTFSLTSKDNVPLPVTSDLVTHFDSDVEHQFYQDFSSLNLGWEIKREPTIVKTGTSVIIPDFGFYKDDMVHFLEIVGFWTPEYLKKKISKLRVAEAPITIVVNENLNCKKDDFLSDVLFYTTKISIMPIVNILKDIEEKQIQKELQTLQNITVSQEIISIQTLAEQLHVHPKTLTRVTVSGHILIGDYIVSEHFLNQIKKEIRPYQDYETVEEILKKHSLTTLALDAMGYKVIWVGLHPTKVVEQKSNRVDC
jgi:predicted nuclease of restriction endonuclease-like RecB superfamily